MAPGEQWEVELRRKMADSFLAELRAHELPYDNDTVVVLAIRDVTLQAEYERHLLQLRKKAQELSQLKTAFLTNISHEIRTPLTSILGFARVLGEIVSSEQQRFVDQITESGERLRDP